MGVIHLPDELQREIDRQVAEGKAANPAEFLEEAVRRLVDETRVEADELLQTVEAGLADIEAGRFVTMATPEDKQRIHDGMMARLQARLSTGN